jgi:hypothetical protein
MRLPIGPLEAELSARYGRPVTIEPERIRWAAVTNHCATAADCADPPSDFYSQETYRPATPAPCVPDEDSLCLNGGRFEVTANWTIASGSAGGARAVGLTADSGYFWFFQQDNVELLVKVLDACSFVGRYWVFAAGLTDVAVTFQVRDTQTGAVQVYLNPQGQAFLPLQDTEAFSGCP